MFLLNNWSNHFSPLYQKIWKSSLGLSFLSNEKLLPSSYANKCVFIVFYINKADKVFFLKGLIFKLASEPIDLEQ